MNREVNYIGQGFLLMLVVVAGIGMINWMQTTTASYADDPAEGVCGTIDNNNLVENNSPGAVLFRNNCATCHKVDKDLTGPALRDVETRVKNKKLLYGWIRNNEAVLKSGNPYFNNLYNKWGKTPMNVFSGFTDNEIEAILLYIKTYKTVSPPSGIAVCPK